MHDRKLEDVFEQKALYTKTKKIWLDENFLSITEGVYLVRGKFNCLDEEEINVYDHSIKGLSCFANDFGSGGTEGVDDRYNCYVSVQFTGLQFIKKVRELSER